MEILLWILLALLLSAVALVTYFYFADKNSISNSSEELRRDFERFQNQQDRLESHTFDRDSRVTRPDDRHARGDDYAEDYLDRIPEAYSSLEATFNGKGMTFHKNNWVGLYKKLGRPSGDEVEIFAVLVPERTNKNDATAVSIAVHGRVIARVPAEISAKVTRFIDQHGGLVKVRVVLWFDPSRERSTVRVHLAEPMRMLDDFYTDLRVVRRIGAKWNNELIGFVD
jgi:hypothetical protein